jgi:hypothetical protein
MSVIRIEPAWGPYERRIYECRECRQSESYTISSAAWVKPEGPGGTPALSITHRHVGRHPPPNSSYPPHMAVIRPGL